MGLVYRDEKGRFVKPSESARVTGYRKGGKVVSIDLEKVNLFTKRNNEGRAVGYGFRSGGKFIPKEIGEQISNLPQYKKAQEKVFKDKEKRRGKKKAEVSFKSVAFFELASVFRENFVNIFGYKSAEVVSEIQSRSFGSFNNLMVYLNFEANRAAAIVEEANDDADEGTPTEVFNAEISMLRPGVYFISLPW